MWFKILGRIIFIAGILWFMFLVFPYGSIAIWITAALVVMIIGLTIEFNLPMYIQLHKDKPTTDRKEKE